MSLEKLTTKCSKYHADVEEYEEQLNAIFDPPKDKFIDILKIPEYLNHRYQLYLNKKGKKSLPKPQFKVFQETLSTYNYHLYEQMLIQTHSAIEFREHIFFSVEKIFSQCELLFEEIEDNISCLYLEKKAYELVADIHAAKVKNSLKQTREIIRNIRKFLDQCSSTLDVQQEISNGRTIDYSFKIDLALRDDDILDFFKGALHLFQNGQNECFDLSQRQAYFTSARNLLESVPGSKRGTIYQQLTQQMADASKQTDNALKVLHSIDGQATHLDPELLERHWKRNRSSSVLTALGYLQEFAFHAGQMDIDTSIDNLFSDFFGEPMNLGKIQELNEAQRFLNNIGNGPLRTFIEEECGGPLKDLNNLLYFSNVMAGGYWDTLLYSKGAVNNYGLQGSSYQVIEKQDFQMTESHTPTAHREIGRTGDLRKMKRFVRFDPQLTPQRLMSGQQPYKKYYTPPTQKVPEQIIVRREIKYYLLDASPSMKFSRGLRASFRDALLIGQLNQSIVEAQTSGVHDTFFVQTFDMNPHELHKVTNEAEAKSMISKIYEGLNYGKGTDITKALIQAFETIAKAQESDPDLYKASVVLVTDGEDEVDKEAIEKVRKSIREDLEIVFHFVSIVIGNEDLKSIVESQTNTGIKAQFLHVTMEDIEKLKIPPDIEEPVHFDVQHDQTEDAEILKSFQSLKTTYEMTEKSRTSSIGLQVEDIFPPITKPKIEAVIAPFETISTVENILSIVNEMKLLYITTDNKEEIALSIFEYLLAQHNMSQELYLQVIHNDASSDILDRLKRIRWGLGLEKEVK